MSSAKFESYWFFIWQRFFSKSWRLQSFQELNIQICWKLWIMKISRWYQSANVDSSCSSCYNSCNSGSRWESSPKNFKPKSGKAWTYGRQGCMIGPSFGTIFQNKKWPFEFFKICMLQNNQFLFGQTKLRGSNIIPRKLLPVLTKPKYSLAVEFKHYQFSQWANINTRLFKFGSYLVFWLKTVSFLCQVGINLRKELVYHILIKAGKGSS